MVPDRTGIHTDSEVFRFEGGSGEGVNTGFS